MNTTYRNGSITPPIRWVVSFLDTVLFFRRNSVLLSDTYLNLNDIDKINLVSTIKFHYDNMHYDTFTSSHNGYDTVHAPDENCKFGN